MLSDAPNASWHPALMPNSVSDLPRDTRRELEAGASSSAGQDTEFPPEAEPTTDFHNQSVGPDAWFPDYGSGDAWIEDANNAPTSEDPSTDPTTMDATDSEPTGTASKHFSTMSFTRTVPHEVSWNDDDDPEWNLARTGTDPFKFMPPNDRTNSFPAVPVAENPVEDELEQPNSPIQTEAMLHEPEPRHAEEAHGAFDADPEALGASFNEEDLEGDDFFHQVGGNISGTAEEAMEARFEEGVPLIPTATDDAPDAPAGEINGDPFQPTDDAEEDDFFAQVRDDEAAQPNGFSPLQRKSTMQVLDALDAGETKSGFTPMESTVEEEADVTAETPDNALSAASEPAGIQVEGEEDLDAKWKAMFGDEEEDGFLPDDIDAAGFLGSDDEGLLEDSEAPSGTELAELALPTTVSAAETQPVNGRYLPPSQPQTPTAPTANPYLPAALPPVQAAANPYFPAALPAVPQPPVPSPYPVASSAPPAAPRYGPSAPPSQEQNKPQSFVDKSKGGYTSPYDLPMEVVKPKLRAPTNHMQRSTSTPNAPPPGPYAPPRSSSLNSPLAPPAGFGSHVPPPSSHPAPPPPGVSKPPAATAKPKEKFFEDLPITSKPRPSSRHSNKSVPSPPQASPYAPPPPQAGPPPVAQPPSFQAPPVGSQPSDIPTLVAPPRVSPYASLPSGNGLIPSALSATPSRYSPASAVPPGNGPPHPHPPAAAASRYSPAPPVTRQVSAGYGPASVSAPPILPHQPRTSSPLAHFEISHERSRAHVSNHAEGGLSERRSASSVYQPHLQRVSSLPTTTEVEEEESSTVAQTPTAYNSTPPSTSPESRYGQVPIRPRQTPPPPSFHGQSTLSPPKRATSSHGLVPAPHDFAPPPRSQTQSPGKLYGNRNGKPVDPTPRPSSAHGPVQPPVATPAALVQAPSYAAPTRPRGLSQNVNYVAPTDGREKDPLQRWRGVPVISWGVGGTMVTMFPKDVPRYGIHQTVPMVVRSPGEVKVKNAKDIQPLEERLLKFPGPLKGKSKKKEVIAWLNAGIELLERDQPSTLFSQVHSSHEDKRVAERVLLWKILRLLIEHDGVLEGNPAVEKAVRDILTPNLEAPDGAPTYITGADAGRLNDSPVTRMLSDAVDASTTEKIRKHLLNGDSEKAIWTAADSRLWGHALLLANALAPSLYKQVSQEFIKKEVNFPGHNNESLAALYGVLSGNHEESVDELVPVHARAGLQLVAKGASSGSSKDAMDGLDKWRETLSLILSNRSAGDAQSIKSLGNLLASYGRAEAAHICYMFARNQAVFAGLDDPNCDFVLVGSDHKKQVEQFAKEIEPLLLSEVYEYGQSLAGGSNVAVTNPHLAAYKLQHAYALAEYGYRDKALHYCEGILAAIAAQTKRSPYHHSILETAVEDLGKRLKQAPKEESNSWIPKPSMNKVSDSVWNRFNKFVAGDDNEDSGQGSPKEGEAAGPFARVAGGTPTISRSPSTNNLETFGAVPSYGMPPPLANGPVAASAPPTRAASRYAPAPTQPVHPVAQPPSTSAYESYAPRSSMERASTELARTSSDFQRRSSESQRGFQNAYTPAQSLAQPASPQNYAPPAQGFMPYGAAPVQPGQEALNGIYSPTQAQPQVPAPSSYDPSGYSPAPVAAPKPADFSEPDESSSGYQPPSYGYEPPSSTPYEAPTKKQNGVSEEPAESSSFEPPYQPYSYEPPSYEPDSQTSNRSPESDEESKPKPKKKGIMYDDDDDDFPKPAVKTAEKSKAEKDRENEEMFRKVAEEEEKRAAEAKAAKAGGWGFSSWFKGGAAKKETPEVGAPNKPIRAKLGEANSFYYDPELKRWVNKNADPKDNEAKKATPPPPKGMPRSVSSSPAPPMGMPPPTSNPDAGRASAPPAGPPRSTMTPPPPSLGLAPSTSENSLAGPPSLGPPAMMRSVSNTSTASAPSRPTTSLSNSSSIDDLLAAAAPRKAGSKKPRKSARYVDVMTKD